MATKTITITTDAYERLHVLKEGNESFSDVITKITFKRSLLDLIGILTPKEAAELKKHVKETRIRMDKEVAEVAKEFR